MKEEEFWKKKKKEWECVISLTAGWGRGSDGFKINKEMVLVDGWVGGGGGVAGRRVKGKRD